MKKYIIFFILWFIIGYVYDVIYRPYKIFKQANKNSAKTNKPLLNIGAGTKSTSMKSFLFGNFMADINMDINGEGVCNKNNVCYGNLMNIPYKNKHFSGVFASHVLEHVDNPKLALKEMNRVADKVYILVPLWWCLHTWFYWDHMWYINLKKNIIWKLPWQILRKKQPKI